MKDYVSFECTHFDQANQSDPDERRALAYADIDGYTADENEEGTVICRVWLMKEKDGIYPTYLVDWHHNGYRMNEEVKNLIKEAKNDLVKFLKDLKEQVFARAYEKYKLQCMLDKSFTLDMLLEKLQPLLSTGEGPSIKDALETFENEMQFAGSQQIVWECEDVFRVSEWENEDYMRKILDSEVYFTSDYAIWKYK